MTKKKPRRKGIAKIEKKGGVTKKHHPRGHGNLVFGGVGILAKKSRKEEDLPSGWWRGFQKEELAKKVIHGKICSNCTAKQALIIVLLGGGLLGGGKKEYGGVGKAEERGDNSPETCRGKKRCIQKKKKKAGLKWGKMWGAGGRNEGEATTSGNGQSEFS